MELVQLALRDKVITEEAAYQAVALILKGVGDYRGIGLVEVVWKAVAVIFNCHFTAASTYHYFLHVFQAGCGMGTATLDIKLLHQVATFSQEVLNAIFLHLHKTYYDLDRSR